LQPGARVHRFQELLVLLLLFDVDAGAQQIGGARKLQRKARWVASKRILVTGAAGFIGSAVARRIIRETPHQLLVYDKLTYAGNLASLAPIADDPRYTFVRGDICEAT